MLKYSSRFLFILLTVALISKISNGQAVLWRNDLEAAKLEARQTNKLVLVHFWATWCPACIRMQREVFVDPAVAAAVDDTFIPVKLDFDQYQVDARAMGVTILPTDVVLSPNGDVVGTIPGFSAPLKYVSRLTQVKVDNRQHLRDAVEQSTANQSHQLSRSNYGDTNPGPIANAQRNAVGQPSAISQYNAVGHTGPTGTPADYLGDRYSGYRGNQLAPATSVPYTQPYAGAPQPAIPAEQPQTQVNPNPNLRAYLNPNQNPNTQSLGQSLPGYYSSKPVTASQPQTAMQSPLGPQVQPRLPVQPPLAGHNQQPASGSVRQQPTKVATGPAPPEFGLDGFCPVTLVEKKAWKFGDRRWGAVHLGVTYLFCGLEEQQKFLKTPDLYSPVCKGNDIVMLLEKGQTVPGVRNHGVSFAGRIYLFSSQETLDAFTKQPRQYIASYAQLMQTRLTQNSTAGLR